MKPYTLKIPVGEFDDFDVGAGRDYIRVKSSRVAVTIKTERGDEIVMEEGDDIELKPFDGLSVSHDGSGTETIVLYVGQGTRAGSSKVGGVVQVVDGGKKRTEDGLAFFGGSEVLASAGQYPNIQLINDAANTKNIIVRQIISAHSGSGTMSLRRHDVALAVPGVFMVNKLIGGPVGVGQLNTESNASVIGTQIDNFIAAAYENVYIALTEPLILPPGKGVHMFSSVLAGSLAVAFEAYEEDI